jgi:hypothetical protein
MADFFRSLSGTAQTATASFIISTHQLGQPAASCLLWCWQKGQITLFWLVPCLGRGGGCGHRGTQCCCSAGGGISRSGLQPSTHSCPSVDKWGTWDLGPTLLQQLLTWCRGSANAYRFSLQATPIIFCHSGKNLLGRHCYYPHFIDEQIAAQKSYVTCPE